MKKYAFFLLASLTVFLTTDLQAQVSESVDTTAACTTAHTVKATAAVDSIPAPQKRVTTTAVKKVATGTTEVFTVYGNCGMCKKTIEGALTDVAGVSFADWNMETKQMTVTYAPELISLDDIKQKIADVGYDSETHRAKNKVYNKLHHCCKYERPDQ